MSSSDGSEITPDYETSAIKVWKLEVEEGTPLIYFKVLGTSMSEEELGNVFDFYREFAASRSSFLAAYDLTLGLPNFVQLVPKLVPQCHAIKQFTRTRVLRSAALCPSALARSVVRSILALAPSSAPFFVTADNDELWAALTDGKGATE
jgi:hypothetical protein